MVGVANDPPYAGAQVDDWRGPALGCAGIGHRRDLPAEESNAGKLNRRLTAKRSPFHIYGISEIIDL